MVKIEKIIPGGEALGTLPNGKKAFFWNALPGEEVEEYFVNKEKTHFLKATATKIRSHNPHRKAPKDECYLSTSPWQIIDFQYELILKSDLVQEIFREHGININRPEIVTNNQEYFYRNKMEYSLYWDNLTTQISLAFHQRGSHRKIPITHSSIERPEILAAAQEIVDKLNRNHEEARKYQSLILRCNQSGEISGGLYENNKPHPKFTNLSDHILDQKYSYSPNGFFQINLPVYEMALMAIKPYVATENVLDLYSGVGTIGLSVARDKHLTLVECNQHAFNELQNNIPRSSNQIKTVLDKSENVTKYIDPSQTVILDPPRAGCDHKLINKLHETKPAKIIYLSCNPATQARDIKLLLDSYSIEEIKTFNFFPHTPHIENLVILSL